MSYTYRVIEFLYWHSTQRGEQWGLGIADLDGDGFLDLYANHHGSRIGREIIYGFATDGARHEQFAPRGADFHGVSFFDIDQDGDLDMLQGVGGDLGNVEDPAIPTNWNRVNLNVGGVIQPENRIGQFSDGVDGMQYGPGRGRLLIPVNFDGQVALYVGVRADRADGSYPGDFFGRSASGVYRPIEPLGDAVSGELAKGVHFGADRFVDVLNVDQQANQLRVFENTGSGFGQPIVLSRNRIIYDAATGDFDGDLQTDILLSRVEVSPIPGQQIYGQERLFTRENGVWTSALVQGVARDTRAVALTAGDFDNDGDLDYAALQLIRGLDVRFYLNNGDGTFTPGERVRNASLGGENAYLYRGDFDRDGTLDLVVTNSARQRREDDGAYVLIEGEANDNHWLSLQLAGTVSERSGLGARVYVTGTDGRVQMREQDGGARFQAQDSTDLHFGLGESGLDRVQVVWADGYQQIFQGLAIDRHLSLTERRLAGFDRTIEGGPGIDQLRGTAGRDYILGGTGSDILTGREGADRLEGGGGRDRLYGGQGADLLIGGGGADLLTGGAGADVFRFLARTDSLPTARDLIHDFQPGSDVIDLRAIDAAVAPAGDQAFEFIGAAAFGRVAGQLRVADGIVSGDTDGDGVADFQIELRGSVGPLSPSDFLL